MNAPDGTPVDPRFPLGTPKRIADADEFADTEPEWRQLEGARPGIEIHRDGKTMRNTAPAPPAHAQVDSS